MDTTPQLMSALDAGDFQRLGVKPQEYRLTVIRRAATRAAMMLARTRETTTGDQWERQLSEVVASTYRLLDPRRRADAVERAHVGRILPGALSAAGNTRFHAGPFAPTGVDSSDHDAGAPLVVGDAAIIEAMHYQSWSAHLPHERHDQPDWNDLVRNYGARRRREQVRDWVHQPKIIMALIVALLMTAGWLFAWQRQVAPYHAVTTHRAAAPQRAIGASLTQPSIGGRAVPSSSEASPLAGAVTVSPSRDAKSLRPPKLDAQTAAKPSAPTTVDARGGARTEARDARSDERSNPSGTAAEPAVPLPSVDRAAETPSASLASAAMASTSAEPLGGETKPVSPPAESDLIEPEWVWLIESPGRSPSPAGDIRLNATLSSKSRLPKRFPIFGADEVAAINEEIRRSLIVVDYFEDLAELKSVQQRVAQISASSTPGTVEHWSSQILLAAPAWYSGASEELQKRWQLVATQYDVAFEEYVQQTLLEATALPCSARLSGMLLDHGLTAAQWLLSENEIAATQKVAGPMRTIAERFKQADALAQIDLLLEAAKQSERSRQRVETRGAVEGVSASEATIIGRHLCFVNAQWMEGLPWLAVGSDARLAAIAARELELVASDPTAASWVELSESWRAYAGRLSGRGGQIVQLHAVELLSLAISQGTAIEKLRWGRQLQTLQSELPPSLRGLQAFVDAVPVALPPEISTAGPSAEAEAATPVHSLRPLYLDGMLVLGQGSRPIGVRYQSGAVIEPAAFSRFRESPQPLFLPFRLDCATTFSVTEAVEVRIAVNVASSSLQQTVYLDDQPLAIDPLEGMGSLRLAPGEHRLRWVVDGRKAETLFLTVEL